MNQEALTSSQTNAWIEIGTIVAPQGLNGEVRVYPDSDFPERFLVPGTRWLQNPKTGNVEETELLGGKYLPGKNLYVLRLVDIKYRDQAEALRDYKLVVPASDRPELEADEFHVADLVNLEVYHQETGENLGFVSEIYYTGNDLLEVTLHKQPEVAPEPTPDLSQISRRSKRKARKPQKIKPVTVLIPFVMEIVPVVDLENKRIEIIPPEGLIETNN